MMAASNTSRSPGRGGSRVSGDTSPAPAIHGAAAAPEQADLPQAHQADRCVVERCVAPAGADDSHGTTREPRRWRIEFPPRQKLLNANQRLNHYTKARIVKQIRRDAFLLAKAAKVPALRRARVDAYYEPPGHGRRDASNWADTAKAAVDGAITDAGVLPDDSSAYLDGPFMHLGPVHPGGRFVLVITEILETP